MTVPNDTVTHLLVSFNHLEISIQLTVKAHPGALQQRNSLSAMLLSGPHFHKLNPKPPGKRPQPGQGHTCNTLSVC